jgi:predicted membrane-bound dolichyl-phosphate-mannose-protein mannosyltransferase
MKNLKKVIANTPLVWRAPLVIAMQLIAFVAVSVYADEPNPEVMSHKMASKFDLLGSEPDPTTKLARLR